MATDSCAYIQRFLRLLAAVCCCLIAGCGQPPKIVRESIPLPQDVAIGDAGPGKYGGILVLNETTQPTTFNPQVPNNLVTSLILSRLMGSLVEFNPRTGVNSCRAWPSLGRWAGSEKLYLSSAPWGALE